ncbi:MAG: hypothetical protein CL583_07365 [Alteromonadaceae bacterium]|nr:hypothetical protein [Alteromonadaceae bacterium]|tara:strand:- start:7803 stop:8999 length:1197 start_codon:yes stop_codon:yes gene_type:complete
MVSGLASFLDGAGETDSAGQGCWARQSERANITQFGAIEGTTTDCYAAVVKALSVFDAVYVPEGAWGVSAPIEIGVTKSLVGANQFNTILYARPEFVGSATIDVVGAQSVIEKMRVEGRKATNTDAIRITNGRLLCLRDLTTKFGIAGIRLISGNSQRWYNVYSESNDYGFKIEPDGGNDTNGCFGSGLRAYNSALWGFHVSKGGSSVGHMHSTWDISAEGNVNGIYIRGGRYNNYNLYSETNTEKQFDLDKTAANFYFLKNPDNEATDVFSAGSSSMGYNGTGTAIFFDPGPGRTARHGEKNFTGSSSLPDQLSLWTVTNTSGSTVGMTLSFLATVPIGVPVRIIKADNTPGMVPSSPSGIALIGATGTFGAYPANAAVLTVTKVNSGAAILESSEL